MCPHMCVHQCMHVLVRAYLRGDDSKNPASRSDGNWGEGGGGGGGLTFDTIMISFAYTCMLLKICQV